MVWHCSLSTKEGVWYMLSQYRLQQTVGSGLSEKENSGDALGVSPQIEKYIGHLLSPASYSFGSLFFLSTAVAMSFHRCNLIARYICHLWLGDSCMQHHGMDVST